MLVTIEWMKKKYDFYNKKYWGGKLPIIGLAVNNSRHFWGSAYAVFRRGIVHGRVMITEIKPEKIVLSNFYESPESVKETTLLHEMIHIADYALHPEHYIGRSRHSYDCHGKEFFLPEAHRLAADGWDIEKNVTDEEENVSRMSDKNVDRVNKKAAKGFMVCIGVDAKYPNVLFFQKTGFKYFDKVDAYMESRISDLSPFLRNLTWYECYSFDFADIRSVNNGYNLRPLTGDLKTKAIELIKSGEMKKVKSYDLTKGSTEMPIREILKKYSSTIADDFIKKTLNDKYAVNDMLYELETGNLYTVEWFLPNTENYKLTICPSKESVMVDKSNKTVNIWMNPKAIRQYTANPTPGITQALRTFVLKQLTALSNMTENRKRIKTLKDIITEEINNMVASKNVTPLSNVVGMTKYFVKDFSDEEGEFALE